MELVPAIILNKKERDYIQYALEFTIAHDKTLQGSTEYKLGMKKLLRDIKAIGEQLNQKKTLDVHSQVKKNFLNGKLMCFTWLLTATPT